MPIGWDGKPLKNYDYSWIEWGWMPGWDRAFGKLYMDELGAAIKECGQKDFQILQIKEKYGQARLYCNGTTQKVHDIIRKYEFISEHICCECGVEAPMVGTSWIYPQCYKCFAKHYHRYDVSEEELYQKYLDLAEDPDENGEWHIPNTYTIRQWNHNKDEPEDMVYDISDTAELIRKRQSKWRRKS